MKVQLIVLAISLISAISFAQDEEADSPWDLTAGSRYMSRYTNYGVDLSGGRAALGYDLDLSHEKGFQLSLGAIQTLGSGGSLQQWLAGIGYDLELSEILTLSAAYTHFEYSNDSVNVLAGLTNQLSFSVNLSFEVVDFGFSYDTFLGTNSASYYGLDVSSFHQIGKLSILPMVQVTFMSQDVENRLLRSTKFGMGKGGGPPSGVTSSSSSVTTVTGLSGFSAHLIVIYPIIDRLSLTIHPYYQYSPKAEVSTRTSQFIWSVGLRYSFSL